MQYVPALRILAWLAVLVPLALQPAAAQTTDDGAPPVAKPSAARSIDSNEQDFTTYPLIVDRIAQRGGIKGNIGATRTVEGRLSTQTYRLPADRDVDAIAAGYVRRLGQSGFDILFQCAADACGPTFVRSSPGYRAHADLFDTPLSAQHYVAARLAQADGDVYTAVQTVKRDDGVIVQIDTVRVQPREIGAISINAAQMAKDLATKGRVALYGIFFNTDSAQIKPESRPTLDEIARLMSNKPNLRLLVVGHTDSRGTFDYNIDLSSRRAQAVVEALTRDYDIAQDRLKPWGVGYAAPRASNGSGIGQAKNRRVELVIW